MFLVFSCGRFVVFDVLVQKENRRCFPIESQVVDTQVFSSEFNIADRGSFSMNKKIKALKR